MHHSYHLYLLIYEPFNYIITCSLKWGFPDGSGSKESACNAGDLGSIPGSGRSPGEGNGYPLQGASQVALVVKNLSASAGDVRDVG